MSAATFVAINSANNSIAAANASRAHAKYVTDCRFVMEHGGVDATNTTSEKQAYAECVKVVYPVSTDDSSTSKIVVATFLIAALIGFVIGWIKNDMGSRFESACFLAIGGIISVVVGGIILCAIQFVFS